MIYRRLVLIPSLLFAAGLGAHAGEAPQILANMRPVAVTVFNDRATVTRTGTVPLPAGDAQIIVRGVPAAIVQDSVKAAGKAAAAVLIGSVETQLIPVDDNAIKSCKADHAIQIRDLDDQIAALDVQIAAFDAAQRFITNTAAAAPSLEGTDPTAQGRKGPVLNPESWKATWSAIRDGMADIGSARLKATMARRSLADKKAALEESQSRQGCGGKRALEIAVAVHAEQATPFDLELTYQVPNATWHPVYEARLDTVKGNRLDLREEAVVTQATGEDWSDVALKLSTSQPSRGVAVPTLAPWKIDIATPRPLAGSAISQLSAPAAAPPAFLAAPEAAMSAATDREMNSPSPVSIDAQPVLAEINTTGLSVEVAVPGLVSVRSDRSERRVAVGGAAETAILAVKTIPRLAPHAYLLAKFTDSAPTPYLPGPVSLYLDGVFVGKDAFPLLQKGEETCLSFGQDDRVLVSYNPLTSKKSQNGMLWGQNDVQTGAAKIVVKNLHETPMEITVIDQLPVSGNDKLVVKMTADPAPSATDIENKPGILAWTATQKPKEERVISLGYEIEAPKGTDIIGLRP